MQLFSYGVSAGVSVQNATTIDEISIVADIDTALPASGGSVYGGDAHVFDFDMDAQTATVSLDLGQMDHAGIDAYHKAGDGCGDSLYSVDNTVVIAGEAMRPADVFTSTGLKILDAESVGISSEINVTAVSREAQTCDLVFSVDTVTSLNGVSFKPDDLIRWSTTNGFSLYQATGLDANIDALHILPNGHLLLSMDVSKSLGCIDVSDESVFELGDNNLQLLAFEPSFFDESWQSADLVALWADAGSNGDLIFSSGFDGCININ